MMKIGITLSLIASITVAACLSEPPEGSNSAIELVNVYFDAPFDGGEAALDESNVAEYSCLYIANRDQLLEILMQSEVDPGSYRQAGPFDSSVKARVDLGDRYIFIDDNGIVRDGELYFSVNKQRFAEALILQNCDNLE